MEEPCWKPNTPDAFRHTRACLWYTSSIFVAATIRQAPLGKVYLVQERAAMPFTAAVCGDPERCNRDTLFGLSGTKYTRRPKGKVNLPVTVVAETNL